jgi:tRNA threonylcarbamoyladenosine biosynthesis protein TsaE
MFLGVYVHNNVAKKRKIFATLFFLLGFTYIINLRMMWTFTLENIHETAKQCWEYIGSHGVVAVHGEMGAGKTTFIHALCDVKGVKDRVGSPTFSIINEYFFDEAGTRRKIYHIDLYRVKSEQEALDAGVEDCLYSDHISLVEWPEKAPGIFPGDTLHLHIKSLDSQTRKLEIGNI